MFKKSIFFLLITLMVLAPIQAYAASPRDIPYDFALSRALSRDTILVPMDRDIRQANARARDLLEEYLSIVNSDREAADALYGQRLMALTERDRLQRDRDRISLSIEISLRNHLANISSYQAMIAMLESNVAVQEKALEHAELRHYHGMASSLDISEAIHSLEQTILNLEMSRLALLNERQQLNRLIHQPITANIQIVYDVYDFPPFPDEAESDRFIARLAAGDHNLLRWQDEVEVRRHEWQRQLDAPEVWVRWENGPITPRQVDNSYMRLQHQLATLERDMAARQAELTARNALAEWERLLEEQLAIEAAIAQARANYEDMQNRLAAGLVTQVQVDALQLAYMNEKMRLSRHNYDFWIARLRIEHPYAG